MAFGMQILPKVIQTLSRILFSAIIIWYIYKLIKANYKSGYVACVSVILAGAIGNIIDSIFYGVIFSESTNHNISNLISLGNGYSSWLHGKVVDMFYFPLCEFNWPYWMPFIGGDNFVFFSPIFNFAGALISCGMFVLILFYRNDFNKSFHLIKKNFKALTTDANQQ